MKKNTLKAFTLVEMLIVIVIIGILIAALLPRMQSAQGRARDVARKNDLSQAENALLTYQIDHGSFPIERVDDYENRWTTLSDSTVAEALEKGGLAGILKDPQAGSMIADIPRTDSSVVGEYRVRVLDKDSVDNAGLLLVAHVENEGSANMVICHGENSNALIMADDTRDIELCPKVVLRPNKSCDDVPDVDGVCYAREADEMVYAIVY